MGESCGRGIKKVDTGAQLDWGGGSICWTTKIQSYHSAPGKMTPKMGEARVGGAALWPIMTRWSAKPKDE